jgi:hypothetical protein
MSPDFEYFLRGRLLSTVSHTAIGLFVFCVPFGLVVFAIAEALRPSFIALLPTYIRTRVGRKNKQDQWFVVACSLLLGAITHDVWDSFTHRRGWMANELGLTSRTLAGFPAYGVLQHLSTVVGTLVIAGVIARWMRQTEPGADAYEDFRKLRFVFGFALLAAMTVITLAGIARAWSLGTSIVRAMDAAIVTTLTFSVISVRSVVKKTERSAAQALSTRH